MYYPELSSLQPLNTMPIKGERAQQARLVACLRRHWNSWDIKPLVVAIPNGGSRGKLEGMSLKVEGVTAGIPDLFIVHHNGKITWIEMKDTSGKVSDVQKLIHSQLEALGHTVIVGWSAEDALTKLRELKWN